MEMDSRPMFNHLHPGRPFPIASSLQQPVSRSMITVSQSAGSNFAQGRSSELDITPPSIDEEELQSNSDDDTNKAAASSPGGLSPGADKKKYPEYCRTLKIKGEGFHIVVIFHCINQC